MMKEVIKEAATVEEAQQAAAAALGGGNVQFEVLQMPQKKTLGLFGGQMARVRAYVQETPASSAAAYLKEIIVAMGFDEPQMVIEEDEKSCVIKLTGTDLGPLIGRRGETLDALQYLSGLVANRVENEYYRVTLDIGNYREKREHSLSGLARKAASRAARTGYKTSLEPMNPYERRIIHTAVQKVEGATSWSVGSEPRRHVIIGPSEDNPVQSQRARSNRRQEAEASSEGKRRDRAETRGGKRRERRDRDTIERPEREIRTFVPRSNPLPTADGATPPSKTASETENETALYGRIDL